MARYNVNDDLASAVRDVVHINRNGTSQPVPGSSHHVVNASKSNPNAPIENPFDENASAVDQSRVKYKE